MAKVEEKVFTKAEMKAFTRKYETFLEAQKQVDDFVNFLKEQYDIVDQPDWQIGQNGFFKLQPVGDPVKVEDPAALTPTPPPPAPAPLPPPAPEATPAPGTPPIGPDKVEIVEQPKLIPDEEIKS